MTTGGRQWQLIYQKSFIILAISGRHWQLIYQKSFIILVPGGRHWHLIYQKSFIVLATSGRHWQLIYSNFNFLLFFQKSLRFSWASSRTAGATRTRWNTSTSTARDRSGWPFESWWQCHKTFLSVIYKFLQLARRFIQPILMFEGKAEAYPSE